MRNTTYRELLAEASPEVMESQEQYSAVSSRLSGLLRKKRLTPGEAKLERLLGVLVRDYDRRHALPPTHSTPAETLQFLLEHSARSRKDLEAVFGARSHASEALTGKRPISADQARAPGKLFHVHPGLFV